MTNIEITMTNVEILLIFATTAARLTNCDVNDLMDNKMETEWYICIVIVIFPERSLGKHDFNNTLFDISLFTLAIPCLDIYIH